MGPFLEQQTATNGMTFSAVRPFYSCTTDPVKDRKLQDVLWPLGMIKAFQGETAWRFFPAFGHEFDSASADSRWRLWLLPLLFAGQDVHHENYFGLFPVGGKVNEFLGRDKIIFALFPLYLYSTVKDIQTTDLLFPIVSWTKGNEVRRFRVFPFYMVSEKGDSYKSRSVMWPIWTSVDYDEPGKKGGGYILFPFCGHMSNSASESWMVLPPFFRYTHGKDGNSGTFPWPFVQYSAANPSKLYLWPLWGRKEVRGIKESFFLWPIVHRDEETRTDGEVLSLKILPFVYYDRQVAARPDSKGKSGEAVAGTTAVQDEVRSRYFKLWPLFSYRRELESSRLRVPDLWPTKQMQGIERNWAPLWTLYSHIRVGENREDEVFWGLYRHASRGADYRSGALFPLFSWENDASSHGRKHWDFLMGLVGYEREHLLKTYRLLYFLKFNTGEEEKKP